MYSRSKILQCSWFIRAPKPDYHRNLSSNSGFWVLPSLPSNYHIFCIVICTLFLTVCGSKMAPKIDEQSMRVRISRKCENRLACRRQLQKPGPGHAKVTQNRSQKSLEIRHGLVIVFDLKMMLKSTPKGHLFSLLFRSWMTLGTPWVPCKSLGCSCRALGTSVGSTLGRFWVAAGSSERLSE